MKYEYSNSPVSLKKQDRIVVENKNKKENDENCEMRMTLVLGQTIGVRNIVVL